MSDALAVSPTGTSNRGDIYFEQQIFVRSPFGTLLTAIGLFLFFAGTFALATLAAGGLIPAKRASAAEATP